MESVDILPVFLAGEAVVGSWDKETNGEGSYKRKIYGIHRRWKQRGQECCHRCSAADLGMRLGFGGEKAVMKTFS